MRKAEQCSTLLPDPARRGPFTVKNAGIHIAVTLRCENARNALIAESNGAGRHATGHLIILKNEGLNTV